jgi:hypothetical protein
MSDHGDHLDSVVRECLSDDPAMHRPPPKHAVETLRCCAYNQTRERFLSINVEVIDPSQAGLYSHLATLEPQSETALWIVPFHRISPEHIKLPIDLVYIDRNYKVACTVESFPHAQPIDPSLWASSVLALPAQTVSSTFTIAGDQLILCSVDQLKRRSRSLQFSKPGVRSKENRQSGSSSVPDSSPIDRKLSGVASNWEDHSWQNSPIQEGTDPENLAQTSSPEAPAMSGTASEDGKDGAKVVKSWLQRWLAIEPPEYRISPRESLPWIVAYFFNGGAPTPCEISNINSYGMHLITSERWYIGTVIRMTLTDRRKPTSERSITLNAMVVRWSDNGVGIRFLFEKSKRRRRGAPPPPLQDGLLVSGTQKQLKIFIETLKSDPGQPA